jgi:hypothetical protein
MGENYFKVVEKIQKKHLEIEKDVEDIGFGLKGEIEKLKNQNRGCIKNFQKIKNNFLGFLESKGDLF